MNRTTLAVLLTLVTITAVVEGVMIAKLSNRVTVIEEKTGSRAGGATTPLALTGEFRELEAKQEDEARAREGVEREVAELSRRLDEVADAVSRPVMQTPSSAGGTQPVPAAAIAEAVDQAVEKKFEEMPRGEGGEWKPSLDELRKALALNDDQTDRAERIFDDAKHETFQLLTIPRADGTCFADDLVAAFTQSEDPQAAGREVFARLFTEKIPGREEAYIVEILRVRNATEKSIRSVLTEEQGKKLSRVNLDYLGVKTAYDPFAEYAAGTVR